MFPVHGITSGRLNTMNKVEIMLNTDGVNELLRRSDTTQMIAEFGNEMASQLGDGYQCRTGFGAKDGRAHAWVMAVSEKAKKENLENNTILKAVGDHNDD